MTEYPTSTGVAEVDRKIAVGVGVGEGVDSSSSGGSSSCSFDEYLEDGCNVGRAEEGSSLSAVWPWLPELLLILR